MVDNYLLVAELRLQSIVMTIKNNIKWGKTLWVLACF